MKYYEVLPLSKTGAENQTFTYESEANIRVGSIVTIPLRNRFLRGLVTAEVKKPDFKTREIKKVLTAEPPVTNVQMEIAKKVSELYFSTLGEAINAIFPFDFGKKRRKITEPKTQNPKLETPLKLTADQENILKEVESAPSSSKFLLFGVTGSGKTEIYLQLIEKALKEGRGAVVLVPEISLTSQTLERFEKRFGEKVAVWHSQMLETEKFHAWEKIKSGEKMVVVGARSAIFLPIKHLAYVIMDEEHESSYKQDQKPRYEAKKVAEWLTELTGAKLILGSATPKVESFKKTEDNIYSLLTLNKRIVQDEMPPVSIIDLKTEFQKGNKSIISEALFEAIQQALKEKKQTLLFINRRGAATFILCRDCGKVTECPHCDIPLVYHPSEGQVLKCHHCGHNEPVPVVCPNCQSTAIKYFGLGTQKAEIEVKKLFQKARVCRMDKDTTAKRGSHEEIYKGFKEKDFDILIGTQIIAKGWDLPNVSVVGVISADTTLNLPDFGASERTFSLLTQVAGRTGRGFHPGKVFIQTYNPDAYPIIAAKNHDYISFYNRELKEREKYNYPPFSNLIKLTYTGTNEETASEQAEKLKELINTEFKEEFEILGPVPAFIPKLANKYRWNLVLKIKDEELLKEFLNWLKTQKLSGWTIDVHPDNLL